MPGKRITCPATGLFMILYGVLSPVTGQLPDQILTETEYQYSGEEYSITDPEALEKFSTSDQVTINLNQVTASGLENSGLFSPYQIRMFLEYRDRYGPLLSIYELAGISGFRMEMLMEMEKQISTGTIKPHIPAKPLSCKSRIYIGRKYPLTMGYRRESGQGRTQYAGSPLLMGMRISGTLPGNISFGLAMDKDPGEKWWMHNQPEFLGAYLQTGERGKLGNLIIGRYMLQAGMGLVHGSGLFHGAPGFHSQQLYKNRIRAYGGARECGIQQGVAGKILLKPLEITAWISAQSPDISLFGVDSSNTTLYIADHIRDDGLHRSLPEREGRNLAWLMNTGIQLNLQHKSVELGVLSSNTLTMGRKKLRDSISLQIPGQWQLATSLHIHWQKKKFEIFGEYVPGKKGSTALQAGLRYYMNDFLQVGGIIYNFGANYTSLYSSAFASSSTLHNDRGFLLHLHAEATAWLQAEAWLQSSEFLQSRYKNLLPSGETSIQLALATPERRIIQGSLRLRKKISESTPSLEIAGFRETRQEELLCLDARLVYSPGEAFKSTVRMLIRHIPDRGNAEALLCQNSYQYGRVFRISLQMLTFHIPHWDLRMSVYEPGLFQHFSFPVYSGTGQKLSVSFAWKALDCLVLEGKYSLLAYHDRRSIGSGLERQEGNSRQEAGVQIRLSF